MEPWEQEWYLRRIWERRAAERSYCKMCGDRLDQAEELLYDGLCRYCKGNEEDE